MIDPIDVPAPNAERGEVPLQIGSVHLLVCVEFARLSRLSRAVGTETMDELYRRLVGFEPFTAAAALRCLAVHPDGEEEARALATSAIGDLSSADEEAFRAAMSDALSAHLDAGRKRRQGADAADLVGEIDAALEAGEGPGKPGTAAD